MGFKVPDDLMDKDLTLTEVRQILDNRKTINRVQARLDGLPAKAEACKAELVTLREAEEKMLADAAERRTADAARQASAAEGVGQEPTTDEQPE